MKKVVSPLIRNGKVRLVDSFNSNVIVNSYLNENNIDVRRFFENLDQIQLYECIKTGYRFYHPKSIIGDALFYKELATKRKNYYSRRWEHVEALNFIETKDRVLEIGSGFGSFLSLLKENGIKDISGLELSSLAVKKCQDLKLDVQSKLIEDLNKAETYDVICSFQVLEHVYDVKSFIEASIQHLNIGGKLVIGVPNNNPYLFISDKYHTLNLPPHHAGLWSRRALKNLCKHYPIHLVDCSFEPLSKSYSYFLYFHMKNGKNFFIRNLLKIVNRINEKLTKKILTKFITGRNILVVFKKNE